MSPYARAFTALLALSFGARIAASCAATAEHQEFTGGAASTSTTGGKGGASGATGTGGHGGFLVIPDSGGGCGPKCSADLRDVLACDGSVEVTCGPEQACSDGVCVDDPCGVAAAAKTSYGCDFWPMSLINFPAGACWATYVANVWPVPVKINLEYDGVALPVSTFTRVPTGQGTSLTYAPYDDAVGLGPGEVAVMFMSQVGQGPPPFGVPCPPGIPTALTFDPTVGGTGLGKAFHLTTDRPVAAYTISPYGGGAAARTYATLLLPTAAWDLNYVAVSADKQDPFPTIAMLASEDDTKVTISPVAKIDPGPGVAGTAAGQPVTYTLSKGQYVQIVEFNTELTGSAILADKPIAVWGGNPCIGIGACCCDNAAQQIPPVRALGHEYAAVRYRGRNGNPDESVPWRFVGAAPGTVLTYQPSMPPGAPATLDVGQVADFSAPGPFLVRSQDSDHPFYMAAYMSGGDAYGGEGDPEFVNVVPTGQYLNSYVFFTDPTYSETNLVLVRAPGPSGFQDVTLDCSGVVGGWQPLGPYEIARVDLVTGNFSSVNGCSNGRHTIKSAVPFGVTVWGWGSAASTTLDTTYVSYAYPAGVGVAQLNQVEVLPIPK